jgi:hypothetical protein
MTRIVLSEGHKCCHGTKNDDIEMSAFDWLAEMTHSSPGHSSKKKRSHTHIDRTNAVAATTIMNSYATPFDVDEEEYGSCSTPPPPDATTSRSPLSSPTNSNSCDSDDDEKQTEELALQIQYLVQKQALLHRAAMAMASSAHYNAATAMEMANNNNNNNETSQSMVPNHQVSPLWQEAQEMVRMLGGTNETAAHKQTNDDVVVLSASRLKQHDTKYGETNQRMATIDCSTVHRLTSRQYTAQQLQQQQQHTTSSSSSMELQDMDESTATVTGTRLLEYYYYYLPSVFSV